MQMSSYKRLLCWVELGVNSHFIRCMMTYSSEVCWTYCVISYRLLLDHLQLSNSTLKMLACLHAGWVEDLTLIKDRAKIES